MIDEKINLLIDYNLTTREKVKLLIEGISLILNTISFQERNAIYWSIKALFKIIEELPEKNAYQKYKLILLSKMLEQIESINFIENEGTENENT